MRITLIIFLLAAAPVVFYSCTSNEKENIRQEIEYEIINKAQWLIGTWGNCSEDGNSTEIWSKENDSTLVGESYFIAEGDTLSHETFRFEQRGGEAFFIPTVKNQNDNKAVKFKVTESLDSKLIFTNPLHDFPQKISYERISADSLMAEISGKQHDAMNTIQFPMKRAR